MKKTAIIVIYFGILSLAKSYACSCDTISFENATEWADEIFIGRLIRTREVRVYEDAGGEYQTRIWGALFEIEKKWK